MLKVATKLLTLGTIVLIAAVNSPDVAHAVQISTDRSSWEAALSGSPSTFNFSDIAVATRVPSGTVLPNGLFVSYNQSDPYPARPYYSGFFSRTSTTGLDFGFVVGQELLSTRAPIGLTLRFPSPVEAFGLNLSLQGLSGVPGSTGFIIDAAGSSFGSSNNPIRSGFFGLISDPGTSVSSIRIDCTGGTVAIRLCVRIPRVTVTNISVYSPPVRAIPELSSTLALLCLLVAFLTLKKQGVDVEAR